MRNANLNAFHNTVRKLYNVEWAQLDFLTDAQKDNFFANPPKFFIAADDETAEKLWDVMFPKPPEAAGAAKVVDLDAYRRVIDAMRPVEPVRRRYDYWTPKPVDYEYDTGRVYPLAAPVTSGDLPLPRSYIVNGVTGDVTARAG